MTRYDKWLGIMHGKDNETNPDVEAFNKAIMVVVEEAEKSAKKDSLLQNPMAGIHQINIFLKNDVATGNIYLNTFFLARLVVFAQAAEEMGIPEAEIEQLVAGKIKSEFVTRILLSVRTPQDGIVSS